MSRQNLADLAGFESRPPSLPNNASRIHIGRLLLAQNARMTVLEAARVPQERCCGFCFLAATTGTYFLLFGSANLELRIDTNVHHFT